MNSQHSSAATAAPSPAEMLIRKTVMVNASLDRAFRVFTQEMSTWWPLGSHHIGKVDAERVVMEPFVSFR
jgi:hypothetical protein